MASKSMTVQDACITIADMEELQAIKAFIKDDDRKMVLAAAKTRIGDLAMDGKITAEDADREEKAVESAPKKVKLFSVVVPKGAEKNAPKTVPITIVNETGEVYRGVINRGTKPVHNLPEHALEVLKNAVITQYVPKEDAQLEGGIAKVNDLVEEKSPSYPFVVMNEGEPYFERKEA